MNIDYKEKYIKYKNKYLQLKMLEQLELMDDYDEKNINQIQKGSIFWVIV